MMMRLLVLVGIAFGLLQTGNDVGGTTRVAGVVIDARTMVPVGAANLVLAPYTATTPTPGQFRPGTRRSTTDDKGQFSFTSTTAGKWTISLSSSDYALVPSDRLLVIVPTGQDLQNVVLLVQPLARAVGRVIDSNGQPIQNAVITPYRDSFDDFGNPAPEFYPSARSDDRGQFRLSLKPGAYRLKVGPRSLSLSEPVLRPFSPIDSLSSFTVDSGQETRLADLMLSSAEGQMIHVLIESQVDLPAPTRITVTLRSLGTLSPIRSGTLSPGSHEEQIGPVAPGAYEIQVTISLPGGGVFAAEKTVNVLASDQGPARAHILIPRPGSLRLRTSRAGQPIPGFTLQLINIENSAQRFSRTTDDAGTSVFTGMWPGRYRVGDYLQLPSGFFIANARVSTGDVFENGIEVRGDEEVTMNVVLDGPAPTISGAVVSAEKAPVAGATVALLPQDSRMRHMIVSTITDVRGRFEFEASPGEFQLFAWPQLMGAAFRNAQFMERFDSRATALRIEKGGRYEITLPALED